MFWQGGQKVFHFFFAGQVRRKDSDVLARATQPSAVTLLGVESQMFASKLSHIKLRPQYENRLE